MWETLVASPLGKTPLRKYIVLLATVIVACFSYLLIVPSTALAADASFDEGDTIVYQDTKFVLYPFQKSADDMFGDDIPNDSVMFVSRESGVMSVIFLENVTKNNYTSATTASFITYDDTDTDSIDDPLINPSDATTLSIAPRGPPAAGETGSSSCVIDGGLGWIICPLTRTLATGMDFIYSAVSAYLEVAPLSTTTESPMYRAWDQIRNIANIIFVIGFLVLIYSQITGGGMSNYTIKKILPRVVVAAILVNVSYWISALAVDLSNVIGYSVQDIFIGIKNSLVGDEGNSWDIVSWESVGTLILSGGAIAGGVGIAGFVASSSLTTAAVGGGAIFLFLPLLISVLFVVLITFLILAARQAIITVLIVLAPLAFVAYLLPNTEEWFDKWRKTLFILLLLFPAFSVIFGGAQLASAIIIQNAQGANALNVVILAMGVQVAPLAITPLLLRLGGGVLNRFAGVINNPTKGVFDRGKNWANERRDQALSRGNAELASRVNRGLLDPSRRFSASGIAYRRAHNRQAREDEKTANDSLSAAYFTQTADGRRVHRLGERAKLAQSVGDNENQAAWNNSVRTTPYLNSQAHRSHLAHKRADLYQKSIDADGDEHWAHTQQANPGLQAIRTNTYLADGRAKLTEESFTNSDERALQTQISSTANLRNMKIRSDVDAAHAQFQAANVTARGKAAFQGEIVSSGALQTMNNQTVRYEKEASTIENRLKSDAEANWESTSRTDSYLQGLRLSETRSSDQHKIAEAQWNNLVENIRLKGGNTPGVSQVNRGTASDLLRSTRDVATEEMTTKALQTVVSNQNESRFISSAVGKRLNIRGQASADTLEATKNKEAALIQEWRTEEGARGLVGSDAQLASELRDADTQKRVENQRTGAAKRVSDVEYAKQIQDNATGLATVAGGIEGDTGISQAKSIAMQTIVEAFNKGVAAEKTPLSRTKPSELLDDTNLGSPSILDEPTERISAIGGMIASGSHQQSHIRLWERIGQLQRQTTDELAAATASGDQVAIKHAEDRAGKVKDLQQQVMGDKKKKPFGVGDMDQGEANVGRYAGNIYASTRNRLDTHMSAQTLATMDPDDIRLVFEMARAGKLSQSQLSNVANAYKEWQEDDNLKASLAPKHRDLLNPIEQQFDTGSMEGYNGSDYQYAAVTDDTILTPLA